MKRVAAIAFCLFLCGCLGDKVADNHWLWPGEREALRQSFSLSLKEPDTAQFKWMRVIEWIDMNRTNMPTHYCGLINGKTSPENFSGFRIFAAEITRNSSGAYDHGVIQGVEGAPPIFETSAPMDNKSVRGTTEKICRSWGYVDFSQSD
jgi:hypothetical protein